MDKTLLFGRVTQVTVVGATGATAIIPNAYEIQYIVSFEGGKATAVITIVNPPKASIAIAEGAKSVSLLAGYEKYNGVIFTGKVTETISERNGVDQVLNIKATGTIGSTNTKVSISGAPGTAASAVIASISAKTMTKISIDSRVPDKSYSAGFSFVGIAENAIRQVATKVQARVVHQPTGEIALIPANDNTPPTDIIIITPQTGLLGYPKKLKKNGDGWKITALLNHRAKVGATVQLESEMTSLENNQYVMKKVVHKGNNRKGKATTTIEAYNKGARK